MTKTNVKTGFSIYGDDFDLGAFSKIVGVEPTESYGKGDKSIKFKNAPLKKETCWSYLTKPINTLDVSDSTGDIFDLFNYNVEEIRKFSEKYTLDIKVIIVPIIEKNIVPSLFLNKEFIVFLSKLDAEVDIDLYIN